MEQTLNFLTENCNFSKDEVESVSELQNTLSSIHSNLSSIKDSSFNRDSSLYFKLVKIEKPFVLSSWFLRVFDSNFKPNFQVTLFDKDLHVLFVSKLYKRYSSSYKFLSKSFSSNHLIFSAEIRYIYKNHTYCVEIYKSLCYGN